MRFADTFLLYAKRVDYYLVLSEGDSFSEDNLSSSLSLEETLGKSSCEQIYNVPRALVHSETAEFTQSRP
jgi:hypothetical protein